MFGSLDLLSKSEEQPLQQSLHEKKRTTITSKRSPVAEDRDIGEAELIPGTGFGSSHIYNTEGLLYYRRADGKVYLNDNGTEYLFNCILGGELNLFKYADKYIMYALNGDSSILAFNPSIDPSAAQIIDYGSGTIFPGDSSFSLKRGGKLIVDDKLLLGTKGGVFLYNSDLTLLQGFGPGQNTRPNNIVRVGNTNTVIYSVFISFGNSNLYYIKDITILGPGSTANYIDVSFNGVVGITEIEGIIYRILYKYNPTAYNPIRDISGAYEYYVSRLADGVIGDDVSGFDNWIQVGDVISSANFNTLDLQDEQDIDLGILRKVENTLFITPLNYGYGPIIALINNQWVEIKHPTNPALTLRTYEDWSNTFKLIDNVAYIPLEISDLSGTSAEILNYSLLRIAADGSAIIIPNNINSITANCVGKVDNTLYIGTSSGIVNLDNSYNTSTLSYFTELNINNICYYRSYLYLRDSNNSIYRAAVFTQESFNDLFDGVAPADQPAVFKQYLTEGVTTPSVVTVTNVDFRNLLNPADVAAAGYNINDFANATFSAIRAAAPLDLNNPPVVPMTAAELTNLIYIPFDSGKIIIVIDSVNYEVVFDSTVSPPELAINGTELALGESYEIGGVEVNFLCRGSIVLLGSAGGETNAFPVHVGGGVYRAIARTVIYTRETIYNLRDGESLPAEQGRYVTAAGEIMRDSGKSVPIYDSQRRTIYVFRLVQLINGPTTEGVSGSPADDYVQGFICTWAASGVAPASL